MPALQESAPSMATGVDVSGEIQRLMEELDQLDRETSQLEDMVRRTGCPIQRISLTATRATRWATAQAMDAWLEVLALDADSGLAAN